MITNAPLFGNVLEGSVPLIEEYLVGLALVIAGMAVVRNSAGAASAERLVRVAPLQVIDDDEIEESVVVYIDPSRGL
jgi:hypothetical protein